MSYLPGAQVPNLYLYETTYLRPLQIMGNPVTVQSATPLSSLLQPNMGHTHWAACLIIR
jgi:hypothetical protein